MAVLMALLLSTSAAVAHERREVGKYVIEMGWATEPAVAGLGNGVFLEVLDKATNAPVAGLEKTLTVEVSYGASSRTYQPEFRATEEEGVYVGDIIPTRVGDYVFRLQGKIEDQTVDERFESGPGRFDPIDSPTSIQYPDQADPREELAAVRASLGRAELLAGAGVLLGIVALGLGLWSGLRPRRS